RRRGPLSLGPRAEARGSRGRGPTTSVTPVPGIVLLVPAQEVPVVLGLGPMALGGAAVGRLAREPLVPGDFLFQPLPGDAVGHVRIPSCSAAQRAAPWPSRAPA